MAETGIPTSVGGLKLIKDRGLLDRLLGAKDKESTGRIGLIGHLRESRRCDTMRGLEDGVIGAHDVVGIVLLPICLGRGILLDR